MTVTGILGIIWKNAKKSYLSDLMIIVLSELLLNAETHIIRAGRDIQQGHGELGTSFLSVTLVTHSYNVPTRIITQAFTTTMCTEELS